MRSTEARAATLATVGALRVVPENDLRDAPVEVAGSAGDDIRHCEIKASSTPVQVDEAAGGGAQGTWREYSNRIGTTAATRPQSGFLREVSRPRERRMTPNLQRLREEEASLRDQARR